MPGLYGEHGILPISRSNAYELANAPFNHLFFNNPSIFWFNSSDAALTAVPLVGAFTALLSLCGILSLPSLIVCWFLYLSIVNSGQEFMSFQWDTLLLECGFLAILFCNWRPLDFFWKLWIDRWHLPSWSINLNEPSMIVTWLYRWLLFRLMFSSGAVKLASQDKTWADLTAMTYHFWTQPLPTAIGWLVGQLPNFILMGFTLAVFVIELLVPFFIFATRPMRIAAAALLALLQVFILLSGNYCFFNLLSIVLCFTLADDALLIRILSIRLPLFKRAIAARDAVSTSGLLEEQTAKRRGGPAGLVFIIPATALIVLLNTFTVGAGLLGIRRGYPDFFLQVVAQARPWNLVNHYGLFAVMTTTRPEIIIEGSLDGNEWKEYIFKYKPGPLDRAPPVVAPHQPRLDWQMWFAALGSIEENPWFVAFIGRLLENSPPVTALLEENPFAGAPPKYIRATIYHYHFTNIPTLLSTGKWWRRERQGEYMPVVMNGPVHEF